GGVAHGRHRDDDGVSRLARGHDPLGDALDPVRVSDRGSTVFLDDEGHGRASTSPVVSTLLVAGSPESTRERRRASLPPRRRQGNGGPPRPAGSAPPPSAARAARRRRASPSG